MELKSLIGLVVSALIGTFGVFVNTYMAGFFLNWRIPYLVPTTVDGGQDSPEPVRLMISPLYNNLILILGFGIQHSGMLRGPLRKAASLVFSDESFRVFYMGAVSAYLMCVFYLWAPMLGVLWDIQERQLRMVVTGLAVLSWCGAAMSLLSLDPLTLTGVRPYFDRVFNRKKQELHFVTTGLYGLMRHPTYSFLMLGFWITPTMTLGRVLISVVFTGYTLLAVDWFEEPDLVRAIGPRYEEYQRTTPQYIPTLSSFRASMRTDPSKQE